MTRMDTPTRILAAARRIYEGCELTTQWIRENCGVSRATAKRDLAVIEQGVPVTVEWRGHGNNRERVLRKLR